MIDLHVHSTASDGSLSPSSLVTEAAKRRIGTIALTDHDTIKGNEEAAKAAIEQGIRFIPGIELEISWKHGGEFHLLGLGIQKPSPGFLDAIKALACRRQERNMEIVERMNEAGIKASYDDIISSAHGSRTDLRDHSIGRPHFAAFLAKRKIVKNTDQAFQHYLGKGKPFFIPKASLEFEQAVEIIKESGGIAVLAHPMSLYISWGQLPAFINGLKEKGLGGIEAWHPNAKVSHCKRLEALGRQLGLCVTAGSDFHGEARPERKLGITAGGRKIDDMYLEGLPYQHERMS